MKAPAPYFSGTSNIVLPLRQKDFPPEFSGASRLTYYASLFTSLEVNATFYKLPRPATVQQWCAQVPVGFRFTFKVPKTLSHAKGLQFDSAEVTRFAQVVAIPEEKRGCLLLQLPPSVKRDREEEFAALLENLAEEATGWPIAVEFRDPSWYGRSAYRLLEPYGATVVEHDFAKAPAPDAAQSSSFSYFRYHGPEAGYRGSYSGEALARQAERIGKRLAEGHTVYAYFNNTLGDALANLQTLNALVRG